MLPSSVRRRRLCRSGLCGGGLLRCGLKLSLLYIRLKLFHRRGRRCCTCWSAASICLLSKHANIHTTDIGSYRCGNLYDSILDAYGSIHGYIY